MEQIKKEKNQTKPALRSSKDTEESWRVFSIRVEKMYPSLNGGSSPDLAISHRNSTFKCLFWLQYAKISRVILLDMPLVLFINASNLFDSLISVIEVLAKDNNASNTFSFAVSLPSELFLTKLFSAILPGSFWYSEK